MTADELLFFSPMPDALPLYAALRRQVLDRFPDTVIRTQKSQITFKARYGYAFVSLRRMKGCPSVFLILSFGLDHRLSSPRIAAAAEPYPNRWTHHMVISRTDQLDSEVMDWLDQARAFALTK